MPTSQVGFSTCLVPSRDEILGDNAEKQLCRVVHDKNTNKHWVVVHQKGRWVLGGEPETDFLSSLATIYQANPYFVAKLTSFFCCFNQKRNYAGLYMIGMPMNTHYWFIREVHESWERDQRHVLCPTSPCSTKWNPNFEQNWVVLWLFCPKTQLCRIVHCKNTSNNSLLVNHKGASVLGGKPKADFLPNLVTTERDQPIIWSKIECVCGYVDHKCNYIGSYTIRVPIKTHY